MWTIHSVPSPEYLAELFDLAEAPPLAQRFNIAPTQPVGIVRINPRLKTTAWALTYWGLIPSSSKDPSIGRAADQRPGRDRAQKPFSDPFRRRRCLIPASGFYEWQVQGKGKQPYYIIPADGGIFAVAGLWEQWTSPDGSQLENATILTVEPNELMAPIHSRMPLIWRRRTKVSGSGAAGTTPAALGQLQHLFRPYPAAAMEATCLYLCQRCAPRGSGVHRARVGKGDADNDTDAASRFGRRWRGLTQTQKRTQTRTPQADLVADGAE